MTPVMKETTMMTMTSTLTRPNTSSAPRPVPPPCQFPSPVPDRPVPHPTAATCGACKGDGGAWVTNDGATPGKNIGRWVPCGSCKGSGSV